MNKKTGQITIKRDPKVYEKPPEDKNKWLGIVYNKIYTVQLQVPLTGDPDSTATVRAIIKGTAKYTIASHYGEILGILKWRYGENIEELQVIWALQHLIDMGVLKKRKHNYYELTNPKRMYLEEDNGE